jgi:hypothetical protein
MMVGSAPWPLSYTTPNYASAYLLITRQHPVWLNKSAVSTPLKLLRLGVYWTE